MFLEEKEDLHFSPIIDDVGLLPQLEKTSKLIFCLFLQLMVRAKGAPEPRKHMGHGLCDNISKSITISQPTNDSSVIAKEAINLLQQLNVCASDIRGMGIQVCVYGWMQNNAMGCNVM